MHVGCGSARSRAIASATREGFAHLMHNTANAHCGEYRNARSRALEQLKYGKMRTVRVLHDLHIREAELVLRWLAFSCLFIWFSMPLASLADSPTQPNAPRGENPPALVSPIQAAPSAFNDPAVASQAESRKPAVDPVYISNVPGLGQALPDPVRLDDETATPSLGKAPRRSLTIGKEQAPPRALRGPRITSVAALVVDQQEGRLLYAKNADAVRPIASITKLMTAMVVLDSGLPLDEAITIDAADVVALSTWRSRLRPGMTFTRGELLKLALMASENPAAAALSHSYPGGAAVFVQAMNDKARAIGMRNTRFLDATGLTPSNVSTPYDLALMVDAAYAYPVIREFTTSGSHSVPLVDKRRHTLAAFYNSNRLVQSADWRIGLSKTGYINEAGRCLVMQATIAEKPVIIVLLDSSGKFARIGDANRIKHWLEGDVDGAARMRSKRRM